VTIRVFLVDDHHVVREGLRLLLEAEHDIEVVGDAGTVADALARIPTARPQVAILDVQLPDGSGVEVCREIRSQLPDVACLMLTSFADDEALLAAVVAGAAGYVLKEVRGNDLVRAIRRAAAGESLLDQHVVQQIVARLQEAAREDARVSYLTPQERRVLRHLASGLTNRQIGEAMGLAEKTVKNYVSNVLAKLGMRRRTEAAVFAARLEQTGHSAGSGLRPGTS
jgi:two-component system response regulator DevR